MPWIKYIGDAAHYNEVLSRAASVKSSLWIGTADIKDLYMKAGSDQIPFLGVITRLIERGVDMRLIHAKEPVPIFREEFDRYPLLATRLERALCPRVHFKIMVFDCNTAYVRSANLPSPDCPTGIPILRRSRPVLQSKDQNSSISDRYTSYLPLRL